MSLPMPGRLYRVRHRERIGDDFRRVWSVQASLPSGLAGCIIATLSDAKSGAPGVPVKGLFLGIFIACSLRSSRKKIPAIPLRACDSPAYWVRFVLCIGCDHAAQTRKETPCPTQRNPQRKSTFIRYPLPSGARKPTRAFSTQSRSRRATRTVRESGSPRRASAKASCCSWRRPQTWLTTKFRNNIVKTSTPLHTSQTLPSRPGQGALTSALPFFSVTHRCTQSYAVGIAPQIKTSSSLLPGAQLRVTAHRALTRSSQCCAPGLFRTRNTNLFAANQIFDSIRGMKFVGPHVEQRTSCVLYDRASFGMPGQTTRLRGGSAPVDPRQRGGLSPLLDTPRQLCGGRV